MLENLRAVVRPSKRVSIEVKGRILFVQPAELITAGCFSRRAERFFYASPSPESPVSWLLMDLCVFIARCW